MSLSCVKLIMGSKSGVTKHGIAAASGGGGGLFIFSAIFSLVTACPFLLLMIVTSDGLCIPSEREALLSFKRDLTDPSNALSSWVEDHEDTHGNGNGVDCCQWHGVVCHNSTGHVLQLRLSSSFIAWQRKRVLGGKLSPSLLELKQLTHLDLSLNYFEGIPIPGFLGSLQSLTYLNLSNGGFGGIIPQQLGNLSNLHSLHLGRVYFYDSSKLRSDSLGWVTGLSKLQYLGLSYVNLSRAVDWLQATNTLPSLKQLHLSSCGIRGIPIPTTLGLNFSHLSVLDLSSNDLYSSVPEWIFSLRSLTSLDLSFTGLSGPIPVELGNLTGLTTLDLAGNSFNSSIPEWLPDDLTQLEVLDLRWNSLEGGIPEGIRNMTALTSLHLGWNSGLQVVAHKLLIKSLGNLCNLRELGLTSIKLGQEDFEAFLGLPGCVLSGLVELDLGETQLTGKFGKLVDKLATQSKYLATLCLYSNSLHGPIPESIGRLSSLEYLFLGDNQLNGTLPESLGQLTRLQRLSIFDNQLMGDVTQAHFSNLTELISLSASRNKLSLKVDPKWVPPFQLEVLNLDSWQIGPRFPQWLQSQKHLLLLRLSGVGISSTIPYWFQNSSPHCYYYNLSNNQIHGGISEFVQSVFPIGTIIDLGSNRLRGPLPPISPLLTRLHLSDNHFSGFISRFLCHKPSEPNHLELLDLGKNNMSGEISDCFMNWRSLIVINFENNEFTGQIPSSIQSLGDLQSLHLRNNHLQGELPTSLRDCTSLVVMDLAENDFWGSIPPWIGERLASLKVLNLGSNHFFGNIPRQLCALTSLQVLVLAQNNLSGSIPTCFNNLTAMTIHQNSSQISIQLMTTPSTIAGMDGMWSFLDHTFIATKDRIYEYNTTLGLMTSIDLSSNLLSGEIPKELTSLQSLRSLNLSHNCLISRIPDTMGMMKELESVDFSSNQLFGMIPPSISGLTFINHFNVSNNSLKGKIPLSTQLQSFDVSSFSGNQLCGPPLNDICIRASTLDEMEQEHTREGAEAEWFHASMVIGFIIGFSLVWEPLLFVKSWRQAYFGCLDRLWQSIITPVTKDS